MVSLTRLYMCVEAVIFQCLSSLLCGVVFLWLGGLFASLYSSQNASLLVENCSFIENEAETIGGGKRISAALFHRRLLQYSVEVCTV